jgi:very-short-patch-repair endonuclease
MEYLYNTKETKTIRRNLRKRQTLAEGLLWNLIRNKKCNGLKFFRQYSVGNFVLDFYCPKIRLGIEIDGGQHAEETKRRDENRTKELFY